MKLTPSKEELKLKKLIEESSKILLITHIRIDEDAICSTLLTYYFLHKYYPDKEISIIIQETQDYWPRFTELDLKDYEKIDNIPSSQKVDLTKYNLVILNDVDEIKRCLSNYEGKTKVAIVDHHDSLAPESFEVKVNELRSSATEQVFITYKRILGNKFKVDKYISQYVHIGIFADTGRFLYSKTTSDTYEIMAEIKKVNTTNSEDLWKKIMNMDPKAVKTLGEAINNMKIVDNLCYSYISDEYKKNNNLTIDQVRSGISDNFLSSIARYIHGVDWAFVVFPIGENAWKIGFRSIGGKVDVEKYARALKGGGHRSAASTIISANTVDEALKIVLDTIASNPS